MENSRAASFACNHSHGSPNPPEDQAVPSEAQKLLKSRVVWVQPRGPQRSESDCMCGCYQHSLGFM